MSIYVEGDVIRIAGRCGAEEAESLLAALAGGYATVDVTGCEHIHAAILQVLMAAKPNIVGDAAPILARWILPAVDPARNSGLDAGPARK